MKQTSLFGTKRLTYSQADSPVNHIQPQVNDLGKRTSDISGRRCLERLEKLNHVGSLAKTFTVLLVGMTGWCSRRCKLTWKMKGTKSNRIYFQLHPSTLRTEEIESGLLLPTPTCSETINVPRKVVWKANSPRVQSNQGIEGQAKLVDLMHNQMLPTPTAGDGMRGVNANTTTFENGRFVRTSETTGTKFGASLGQAAATGMLPTPRARAAGGNCNNDRGRGNLEDAIAKKMLPTPATRDYKGARSTEALQASGRNETNSLPDAFHQPGTSSQLNPLFVQEMMGFPENWTLLPFLNGETNPSKPTETPSSHK